MEIFTKVEKSRDCIEKRTEAAMADISWLPRKAEWKQLTCIGAIKTEFESKKGKSQEWHYYISSRKLSATFYSMPERNGRLKACNGCLIFILMNMAVGQKTRT